MEEIKSNARRFITAYNTVDQTLRALYDLKRSLSFSDVIRKCVASNFIVRKYEDALIDYGRLRNAIIHKSSEDYIIAEPHDDVVEEFEKIARLISTPPTALQYLGKEEVTIIDSNANLLDAIYLMSGKNFSNLPVYEGNKLVGVLKGQRVVDFLGDVLSSCNITADKLIKTTKVGEVVESVKIPYNYFTIMPEKATIAEVLDAFNYNRKLVVVIITKNGTDNELPLSIITAGDIIEFNKVIDNY